MKIRDIFRNDDRPFIIAEISQNHDGSLGQAHAYIDAVAECGVDAVKFQTHIAAEESTPYEQFRVNFSYEDDTRYDYWKRMEFSDEQWLGLYKHAIKKGLTFLSSPFSVKALNLLEKIGIEAWKFGAGEVFNDELLIAAAKTKKPIFLSTGLSTYSDIDKQLSIINNYGCDVVLFQCVTAYPSTADMIDIGQIVELRKRYQCKVGISDHSATIYPALSAVTLGASVVEVHVTMSHAMFGPDVNASVDLAQLRQIVEGSKYIYRLLNNHFNHEVLTEEQDKLKKMFAKGMYAEIGLSEGTAIQKNMFKAKKPLIGVGIFEFNNLIGRKLKKQYMAGEPLRMEDIE